MHFSNDGSAWTGWEAYATSKVWVLPASQGAKIVYSQFRDLNNNPSAVVTDTIVLDTTPPTSTAFSPAHSIVLSFTVTWSASDTLSGVVAYDVQYRVGAGGVWTDWLTGTAGTSAVFGPNSPVIVTRTETYFFRVRAHDVAGNVEVYAGGDGNTHTYIEMNYPVFLPVMLR